MTTQNMIVIHLPPVIRHQTYFAVLGKRLKNLGYDITYICLDQDYASYWQKILQHRIISPMRPSSENIKVPKLTDFIDKGNKAHDLPLTEKIILDIQNCQQPHAKFDIGQFTELVLSTLRSLDFVLNYANNVLFFNNSCAMDVYKYELYAPNEQKIIYSNRPGLSGVGSIVFRDEETLLSNEADPERYYRDVIAPKKVALELWFSRNYSLRNYLLLMLITIWVVVFPKSALIGKIFRDLPR
jgi:hypothetical protein